MARMSRRRPPMGAGAGGVPAVQPSKPRTPASSAGAPRVPAVRVQPMTMSVSRHPMMQKMRSDMKRALTGVARMPGAQGRGKSIFS
jgi:hypothetical protein